MLCVVVVGMGCKGKATGLKRNILRRSVCLNEMPPHSISNAAAEPPVGCAPMLTGVVDGESCCWSV